MTLQFLLNIEGGASTHKNLTFLSNFDQGGCLLQYNNSVLFLLLRGAWVLGFLQVSKRKKILLYPLKPYKNPRTRAPATKLDSKGEKKKGRGGKGKEEGEGRRGNRICVS